MPRTPNDELAQRIEVADLKILGPSKIKLNMKVRILDKTVLLGSPTVAEDLLYAPATINIVKDGGSLLFRIDPFEYSIGRISGLVSPRNRKGSGPSVMSNNGPIIKNTGEDYIYQMVR